MGGFKIDWLAGQEAANMFCTKWFYTNLARAGHVGHFHSGGSSGAKWVGY